MILSNKFLIRFPQREIPCLHTHPARPVAAVRHTALGAHESHSNGNVDTSLLLQFTACSRRHSLWSPVVISRIILDDGIQQSIAFLPIAPASSKKERGIQEKKHWRTSVEMGRGKFHARTMFLFLLAAPQLVSNNTLHECCSSLCELRLCLH